MDARILDSRVVDSIIDHSNITVTPPAPAYGTGCVHLLKTKHPKKADAILIKECGASPFLNGVHGFLCERHYIEQCKGLVKKQDV
jgi:hypothetical protein